MRVVSARQNRRAPVIDLDATAVYDFLMSVMVASGEAPDEYEAVAEWGALAAGPGKAALAGLLRQANSAAVLHAEVGVLTVLVPDGSRSVPAFLDELAALPAEQLAALALRLALPDEVGPPAEQVAAALGGDRPAANALLSTLKGEERRRAALWLADPAGVQGDLVAGLRDWYAAVYADQETAVAAIIERDRAVKERIRTEHGPERLLQAIGGTLHFAFAPNVRRVVLAPAVVTRPAIILPLEHTDTGVQIVIFPVADESLEAPEELAPPRQLVRLYKALCDETRLKILRLVTHEELYATEIAERLGLSKATVSHHMMLLRAAGLVEVRGERKVERYYALHHEALDLPTATLRQYLGQ